MDWLTPELFFGTILGTMIVIVGAQISFILVLIKNQQKYTDTNIKNLRDIIDGIKSSDRTANPDRTNNNIKVSIIQPKDWKNKPPKRKKNEAYVIPLPVKGIVTGPAGSVFLAYRVPPSGDYRIIEKMSVSEDGAWVGKVKSLHMTIIKNMRSLQLRILHVLT